MEEHVGKQLTLFSTNNHFGYWTEKVSSRIFVSQDHLDETFKMYEENGIAYLVALRPKKRIGRFEFDLTLSTPFNSSHSRVDKIISQRGRTIYVNHDTSFRFLEENRNVYKIK
ncbi:hypothetical protein CL622_03455 [archaeon]|nr:hypothetical protein [archaeon]